MLSTHTHFVDKENQVNISAKNVQSQKASIQQGPVKQKSRTPFDPKQNNVPRAPNPSQGTKKNILDTGRRVLGDLSGKGASAKAHGKQKNDVKQSAPVQLPKPVSDYDDLLDDYANLPMPEIAYTNEFVESFNLQKFLELPGYIPMGGGSSIVEEDPIEEYQIAPPPYEEHVISESDYVNWGDQMMLLSIEDLKFDDI